MSKELSTQSYKGVRDFYPEDMAVQRYIFDTWSRTAERFGFERYDASILEPSDLYKAKGAENEEMVNEQTYTFTDRGDREVTLRPEMTPTVARLVAGRRNELSFPVRWYSIPNLFRYERMQRGRLREHWQLNCDMFGVDDFTADVEIIALAQQLLLDFGATPDMFEIRVNDRRLMERLYRDIGLTDDMITGVTRLTDRRKKISPEEYRAGLTEITGDETLTEEIILILDKSDEQTDVMVGLSELGISNAVFDKNISRGFDYYTGTIFEVFDVSGENNRSMLGGGRYDNLTKMFGGKPISGIGFGMGDVTMRDFLNSHNLPTQKKETIFDIELIPFDSTFNMDALKFAKKLQNLDISCYIDNSSRKMQKKIDSFFKRSNTGSFVLIGENEVKSEKISFGNSEYKEEYTVEELAEKIKNQRQIT